MSPKAKNDLQLDVTKHKRSNPMALGFLERPALDWLSRHLPRWVTPDLLTGLGFFAAILIGVSYWLSRLITIFSGLPRLVFYLIGSAIAWMAPWLVNATLSVPSMVFSSTIRPMRLGKLSFLSVWVCRVM